LAVPFNLFRAYLRTDLGMLGGDFKGGSPKAAWNGDHLRERNPDSNVHRTQWFAKHQVDRTSVPFGFH
jgi:hypothetical protein